VGWTAGCHRSPWLHAGRNRLATRCAAVITAIGDDFRDFMFENAVRFWGEVNPAFPKGTAVEKAAAEVLTRTPRARAS
jgi:hypothetical protein